MAYSTISNLGLIVACAGINTPEALWAAVMLIVFHAIAKSLLFLSVGSTEHQVGSRNVEDMDGLIDISRPLAILMIIGIAGMFVAPFGMLISKWAAMKAFVDSGNVLIILLIAYGSTITLFFWTKWLGKLIAKVSNAHTTECSLRFDEKASLYPLAVMVIIVCLLHPVVSTTLVVPYIESNMHMIFSSPIDPLATALIISMMIMLFILPIILVPLYKNSKVKKTSVYLAGENMGDDLRFMGSMGQIQKVELRNWYMQDIIKETKIMRISYVLCTVVILAGFFIAMGGVFA